MELLERLFKTKIKKVNFAIENLATKKELSTQEIIKEIHHSFDTEVDKLLKFSSELNNLDSKNEELLQKRERLINLGFENSKEVKEAELEIQRLNTLKQENEIKNNINQAIMYYSTKYPLYRFITEDSVKELCKKYNLVYGTVDKYIGNIPDENLKEIENFKLKDEDEAYSVESTIITFSKSDNSFSRELFNTISSYVKYEEFFTNKNEIPEELFIKDNPDYSTLVDRYTNKSTKLKLEIVAPSKDFNLSNSEIKDFKVSDIIVPDPIVLKPVVFNKNKYYLIVTKWGLEASDSLVTNSKYN